MNRLCRIVASGLGSGYSPWASGTAGSAAFLIIWLLGAKFGLTFDPICIAILCAIGLWSIHVALLSGPEHDPGWIVIDEWAGLSIALLAADPQNSLSYLLAFLFFRVLDALKPPPINLFERLPGALGVMADDLVAGAVAGLCTYGVLHYV